MIVEEKGFKPIIITIETREELRELCARFNYAVPLEELGSAYGECNESLAWDMWEKFDELWEK